MSNTYPIGQPARYDIPLYGDQRDLRLQYIGVVLTGAQTRTRWRVYGEAEDWTGDFANTLTVGQPTASDSTILIAFGGIPSLNTSSKDSAFAYDHQIKPVGGEWRSILRGKVWLENELNSSSYGNYSTVDINLDPAGNVLSITGLNQGLPGDASAATAAATAANAAATAANAAATAANQATVNANNAAAATVAAIDLTAPLDTAYLDALLALGVGSAFGGLPQAAGNGLGKIADHKKSFAGAFARSSLAYEGVPTQAPNNQIRAFGRGTRAPVTILEGARTNLCNNGDGAGGSGATLPTGWVETLDAFMGITVVGTGVEAGIPYVDIRFQGPANTLTGNVLSFPLVASLANTQYTFSAYARWLSKTGNIRVSQVISWFNGFFNAQVTALTDLEAAWTKYTQTRTSPGTAPTMRYSFGFAITAGPAIDAVLRVGGVQYEQAPFESSYIPTQTVAVARAAETYTLNEVAPWIGQKPFTLSVALRTNPAGGTGLPVRRVLDIDSASRQLQIQRDSTGARVLRVADNLDAQIASLSLGAIAAGWQCISIVGDGTNLTAYVNGALQAGSIAQSNLGTDPFTVGNFAVANLQSFAFTGLGAPLLGVPLAMDRAASGTEVVAMHTRWLVELAKVVTP
jgi:hypothetical protein